MARWAAAAAKVGRVPLPASLRKEAETLKGRGDDRRDRGDGSSGAAEWATPFPYGRTCQLPLKKPDTWHCT